MILFIDTSTPICKVTISTTENMHASEWESGRDLAHSLIGYLEGKLSEYGYVWGDIDAIAVYRGPGSFTGLRIGMTVMNTIADAQNIIIVGATGDDWIKQAESRIRAGENDRMVLPEYGSAAHITKPRK